VSDRNQRDHRERPFHLSDVYAIDVKSVLATLTRLCGRETARKRLVRGIGIPTLAQRRLHTTFVSGQPGRMPDAHGQRRDAFGRRVAKATDRSVAFARRLPNGRLARYFGACPRQCVSRIPRIRDGAASADRCTQAAEQSGICNLDGFLERIAALDAAPLAIKPVTLQFLMNIYLRDGEFPTEQLALYETGCRLLCEEQNDSRIGASGKRSSDVAGARRKRSDVSINLTLPMTLI
jgi:hypothetical protein